VRFSLPNPLKKQREKFLKEKFKVGVVHEKKLSILTHSKHKMNTNIIYDYFNIREEFEKHYEKKGKDRGSDGDCDSDIERFADGCSGSRQ